VSVVQGAANVVWRRLQRWRMQLMLMFRRRRCCSRRTVLDRTLQRLFLIHVSVC